MVGDSRDSAPDREKWGEGREQPHQTGLILEKALIWRSGSRESWDAVKYPSGSKWEIQH